MPSPLFDSVITQKSTVLYIDDDLLNLEIFKENFYRDYNVITVSSTKEAQEVLEVQPVKVIISDQCMPNESGLDFIKRINNFYPEIKKIIFTAYSSQELALEAINNAGVYKFILKPWNLQEIKNSIDGAIGVYDFEHEKNELLFELKRKNDALGEAYKKLTESEKKFKTVFSKSHDSIYILNQQREIVEANNSMLSLIACNNSQNSIKQINEYVKNLYPVLLSKPFEIINLPNNPVAEFEITLNSHDNKTLEISSNEIQFNNNYYILSIIRDTSERKMFEKKIIETIIQTQEEAQNKYARELHDGLGPLLSTLKMHIEWIANPDNSINKEKIISHTIETLDHAIKTTKEIANNLSPHILQRFGLINAITSYIECLKETTSIEFALHSNLNERLKANIETVLYRTVLECINNAVKHSKAKKIIIKFNRNAKHLEITINDNGVGFDAGKELKAGQGMGLFNIQSRINHIGGKFKLTSNLGFGTNINIYLSTI
jgi:PAS domain S-box-containing protein